MTARRCVVTGAGGALGPAVVEAFREAGFEVAAGGRTFADVTDLDQVRRVVAGADCIVHAAAMLHIHNPPRELHDAYRRVNVGGTENVVRAAAEAGVRRVVHISTIKVYGSGGASLLTEEATPDPSGIYAVTKLESERIVLGAPSGTVLRLAAVYGPRVKGNYRRLACSVARRRFIPIGSGNNRRTLVYDRDVAHAALLAATEDAAAGEIFNVTDGAVHTVREIIEAIAASAGVRPPAVRVPLAAVRMLVAAVEPAARVFRLKPPVTREQLETYVEDVAVSGEKIQRRLGFTPRYDMPRGWSETLAELRRVGQI